MIEKKEMLGWKHINWIKLVIKVAILALIIYLHPPFWALLLLINTYILGAGLYNKLKAKKILISILIANAFLFSLYIVYRFLGGWAAIIVAHIIGVSFILWANRKTFKLGLQSMEYLAVEYHKQRRARKNARSTTKKDDER